MVNTSFKMPFLSLSNNYYKYLNIKRYLSLSDNFTSVKYLMHYLTNILYIWGNVGIICVFNTCLIYDTLLFRPRKTYRGGYVSAVRRDFLSLDKFS